MSDYLPIEIVQQVLLRLPIKPLLRCTSICQAWYNLITSADFISTHLDFKKSLPDSTQLFIHFQTPVEQNGMWLYDNKYVLYSDDETGNFDEYVRFPVTISTNYWSLVGCCNGLICLANNKLVAMELKEVVLWNPAIQRTLRLPKSDYCIKTSVSPRTFGFVFDHIENGYKVLRFYSLDDSLDEVPTMVEVFRLSTGLWENISYKAPFDWISPLSLQVDLKGIAHWIGKDYDSDLKIITFDMHEEVFGSIELPFDVVNNDENHCQSWEKYLFVFEESLFLIHRVFTRDVYDENKRKFDVWRMGEYNVVESWNQVHTWVFDESMQPLCFRKNDEILWVVEERKLISTNLKDASVNYLGICQNAIFDSSCLYYAESIILLDKSLSSAADDQKVKMLQEWQFFQL